MKMWRDGGVGAGGGLRARRGSVRAGSVRRGGLLVAMGCGVIAAGVLVYALVLSPRGGSGAGGSTSPLPRELVGIGGEKSGGGDDARRAGEGLEIQLVDRDDPGRLAAELLLPSVQPLEGNRYSAERPEIWMYLKGGVGISVRADRARLYLPSRSEMPEQGEFEGDVVIRVYEDVLSREDVKGSAESAGSTERAERAATITARTDRLAFDGGLGEARVPGRLAIEGSGVEFAGRDLRVLFDDVRQRLLLLRIAEREYARFTPGMGVKKDGRGRDGERAGVGAGERAAPARAGAGIETLYRAVFGVGVARSEGAVTLTQGSRELRASGLEVLARLIDNRLELEEAREGDEVASAQGTQADLTKEGPSKAGGNSAQETVELVWSGPLEVTPIASVTEREMRATERLAVRFLGGEREPVVFGEGGGVRGEIGVRGRAEELSIGVREGLIRLLAVEERGVVLARGEAARDVSGTRDRRGQLRAREVQIDLRRGVVGVPGAATIEDGGDTEGGAASFLAWEGGAEFGFAVRDGEITERLRFVRLKGGAVAGRGVGGGVKGSAESSAERGGMVTAEEILAEFEESAEEQSVLRRVTALGRPGGDAARAMDGRGGSLEGERLVVGFGSAGAEEPRAEWLMADGDVVLKDEASELSAQMLWAELRRVEGSSDDVTPGRVVAVDEVRYLNAGGGEDGLAATCDRMEALAHEQKVELFADEPGGAVMIGRGGTYISGRRVLLDGVARTARVVGDGYFSHDGEVDGRPATAAARWRDGLFFDDATGLVHVSGAAEAVSSADAWTRDTMSADWVELRLTPGGAGDEECGPRVLLGVRAGRSGAGERGDSRRVKVESRRYEMPADLAAGGEVLEAGDAPGEGETAERYLERLLYLEGDRLDGDSLAGRLEIEGEGRLLVVDRRRGATPEDTSGAEAGEGLMASGRRGMLRGTAMFDWEGWFVLDRGGAEGAGMQEARMGRGVRMIHERMDMDERGEKVLTELECETLSAALKPRAEAGEEAGELSRVRAGGAVYARSGPQELTADWIEYDAPAGLMTLVSDVGNVVTMFDQTTGAPVSAASIVWEIAKGRIAVKDVRPTVVPR